MSDSVKTPTAKITPSAARKSIAEKVTVLLSGIARMQWQIGSLLAEAQATFPKDGTAAFLTWADKTVGLKKAAVYQYMQAAKTVAETPAAADAVGTVRGLQFLSRFTPDERTAILGAVKGEATTEKLEAAAVKVIDRVKVAADKKAEAEATEANKQKRTNKQKSDAVARKYRDEIQSALIVLSAEAMEDPEKAIRQAILLGATFGAKAPLLCKVLPTLYAEYDSPTGDDGNADDGSDEQKAEDAAMLTIIPAAKKGTAALAENVAPEK